MAQRHFSLRGVLVLLVALLGVCAADSLEGSRPNILILFADDLGYGDLSSNGHPTTVTPNIDRLAHSGIRFTQWYSAFHVCSPSRGSMMTGRLPIRTGTSGAQWYGGVFNGDAVGGLPENETTIAEALKDAGYLTKAVGKWHLGQQTKFLPTNHGFDEYYGIPYSDDMGASAWDYYESVDRPPLPLVRSQSKGHVEIIEQPTDLNLLSDRYVEESVKFIKSSASKTVPFLLYMAFNHVHVPDFANPKWCNKTKRGRFGDALGELDDSIGKILQGLKESGAEENTLVFFTSDNGPWLIKGLAGGSAGLFRGGKQTTWEGGVRMPGIASWPGKIAPGQVSQTVVATYDIFATSLALAGAKLPTDRIVDGKDMSPVLFGGTKDDDTLHDCIFIYKGTPDLKCPVGHDTCPGLWAVRCGKYKLHYVTSNFSHSANGQFHHPPLIYHIEHDPSENYPLSPETLEYKTAHDEITAAAEEHKKGVRPVPNQMLLGKDPKLVVCCDWDSKKKFPERPVCTCNEANYDVFVCRPTGPSSAVSEDL